MKQTIVSAPGKVLIAGGYLVLDPKFSPGLVLTTTSRFFTCIQQVEDQVKMDGLEIELESPQFHFATKFTIKCEQDNSITITPYDNPYIANALLMTCALIKNRCFGNSLKIRLVADNDFYSQRANVSFSSFFHKIILTHLFHSWKDKANAFH